jgi:PPE-repeat protein
MVAAPPEIITGRLMSGAGAAPMTAASGSFAASAAAFEAAIDRLTSHLAWLGAAWQSQTNVQLTAALTRYIAWMRLVQLQLVMSAARTADQAAAFATAYASMAQMVEIVDNRVTTAVLYATNFLGFNTIPIGIREGQYVEMTVQDITVQETYLAATVANTAFEPFVPMAPIVVGAPPVPPVVDQAVEAAANAGNHLMLLAGQAESALHRGKQLIGQGAGLGFLGGLNGVAASEQADPRDAVDRYRDAQANQSQVDKLGQQLIQSLPQQIGQFASQGIEQGANLPQQAAQPIQQFASQISNLMNQVAPEHQLDNPGMFDTHPSSATLDRLAGSNVGSPAFMSALRVPSMAGLSGASTGFRFPTNWDGVAPPPVGESPLSAARPMGSSMGPMSSLRRAVREDERESQIKRPQPELTPVWGEAPPVKQTESAGQWAASREESA